MLNLYEQCVQSNDIYTSQTNAELIVKVLMNEGIECIFGYPGASVLSLYNELSKVPNLKHYLVRHEQAAVHAAEGYAIASNKPGVVLVTSGPGFTNTITGIANAYADSTPLLVLVGDVSEQEEVGKIFQSVDISSISKSICKNVYKISSNCDIVNILKNAIVEANSGVKGPVIIALPRNVLEAKCNLYNVSKCKFESSNKYELNENINKFIDIFNNSRKPLFLIGNGCSDSFEELQDVVNKLKVPVVSTLMGIGKFPTENVFYKGMIGINGSEYANSIINECDLLVALGVNFSDRTICKNEAFFNKTKIISVNLKKLDLNIDMQIISSINKFLSVLKNNSVIKSRSWLNQDERDSLAKSYNNYSFSSKILEIISDYTKFKDPIVVTDVGQHQMFTAQYFSFNKPNMFITSGGMGTMGFGLPASIGAQIAAPESLVLNITGDGSFQMNLQELATCRENNIPIKIIIMNNGYLGMVRQMQEKIYANRYQVEMINPNFKKIAEAYDLYAIRVENEEELIPALDTAIKYNGTVIIDVAIPAFENV